MPDQLPPSITDDEVSRLPLAGARADLLEEIMRTIEPDHGRVSALRGAARRTPRWAVVAAAAAAVLAVVAVPRAVGGGEGADSPPIAEASPTPAPVPAPVPVPTEEPTPRGVPAPVAPSAVTGTAPLLVGPGWRYVASYPPGGVSEDGEFAYERGDTASLELMTYPAARHDSYVEDRDTQTRLPDLEVLGLASRVWAYGPRDHTLIRPAEGGRFLEVRGSGLSLEEFYAAVAQVRLLDEAQFSRQEPTLVAGRSADASQCAPEITGATSPTPVPAPRTLQSLQDCLEQLTD